jgi:hypothetical protein
MKKLFLAADFFVPASRKILVRVGNTAIVISEVSFKKSADGDSRVTDIKDRRLPVSPMREVGDSPYQRSGS